MASRVTLRRGTRLQKHHEAVSFFVALFRNTSRSQLFTLPKEVPGQIRCTICLTTEPTSYQELSQRGDFQPGSIINVTRRCGKPNCHCAKLSDPGHGPHRQLTQKIDGKTVTQSLSSPAAVRRVENEIAELRCFQKLSHVVTTPAAFSVMSIAFVSLAIDAES